MSNQNLDNKYFQTCHGFLLGRGSELQKNLYLSIYVVLEKIMDISLIWWFLKWMRIWRINSWKCFFPVKWLWWVIASKADFLSERWDKQREIRISCEPWIASGVREQCPSPIWETMDHFVPKSPAGKNIQNNGVVLASIRQKSQADN